MIKARKKWKKTRKVHWGCFPLNNSLVKILRSIVVLKSLTSLIIEVSYLCSYIPPYPSRWLSKRIDHINILSNFSIKAWWVKRFFPQFSSQIQHFCYLSGSVWILPKLKTFPKRAKDKQIVRRLSFKWTPPDSNERQKIL